MIGMAGNRRLAYILKLQNDTIGWSVQHNEPKAMGWSDLSIGKHNYTASNATVV